MPDDVSGSDQVQEEETTAALPDEILEESSEEPESQEEDQEEESLEESFDVSGNDFPGYSGNDGFMDSQLEDADLEALVQVCTEINQNIVLGFTATSILLGVLIGIVLVRGFSVFLKGL